MKPFNEIIQQRYSWAKEWKENNQKEVIGWFCIYVPEEIITAAGMLPFRIIGQESETPLANAYLYSNNCTFARSCLEEVLQGKLDFLSGAVICNSCDHIRRLYDVWRKYITIPYRHLLGVPGKVSPNTLCYFKGQLLQLKEGLEQYFKVRITEERLKETIRLYNYNRTLLNRLYDLRRAIPSPISGHEIMEVVLAGMFIPKEVHNHFLEDLLAQLGQQPDNSPQTPKPRILLMGSELDNPEYVKIIEDQGVEIVIEDICCGYRYFADLVEEDGDPIEALTRRYLSRMPCPRMHPAGPRIEQLKELAQLYNINGIVYTTIKFCDLHAGAYPIVRDHFKELSIPILHLEREYGLAGIGQVKTRVQAFLEMLREG